MKTNPVRVWLSLGSNIRKEDNIRSALKILQAEFSGLIVSTIYETGAVGFDGDHFLNLVAGMTTHASPDALYKRFRQIEADHGRTRQGEGIISRTLDIDILTYGDQIIDTDTLQIPRDEITRFAFVLKPLAEVAPDERHPVLGQTYQELWQAFNDASQKLRPVQLPLDL